jgi:hypothetical protein
MMRRLLLVAAALAIPASGVSLALTGGVASASGPKGSTICSTISGTETTTVTISGCVDANGADTGGGTQPISIAGFAGGGTVTWLSGHTSTFSAATYVSTSAKHCPGYVKGATSNPTAYKISGSVTADNSGLKIPGTFKGEVCVDPSGNITAPKPLKIK